MLDEVGESIVKDIANDLGISEDKVKNNVLMYFEEISDIIEDDNNEDVIKMNYLGKFVFNARRKNKEE